ncbi:hypothetical protein [Burkholderia sp. BCC0397]|uniref:hypothetical protein n=1 Tax=Burkholderia sp. BCC0397 TaxID=486876 RepID=UPI00158DAC9F|nr:hypothetical protein [Burkholderia sp. BCC0397]
MPFDDVLRRPAPCNRTVPASNDADLPVILDECLWAPVAARGEQRIEIDERGNERLAIVAVRDRTFSAIGLPGEAQPHQFIGCSRRVGHDNRNVASNVRHQHLIARRLHCALRRVSSAVITLPPS